MPNEELELYYINIGELAKKFDVSVSLIRYWEKEFKHFKPEKSIKGTRKYSKKNIEIFSHIYQLVKIEDLPLKVLKKN